MNTRGSSSKSRAAAALARELAPPYDLLVLTTAWAGLRAGEVGGLRVRSFDPLRSQLRIVEAVDTAGGRQRVETPKTWQQRTVPIPPALARLLAAHVAAQGYGPADYLFGGSKPIQHRNFYNRQFRPAARRTGFPDLRFHDLRHTFA